MRRIGNNIAINDVQKGNKTYKNRIMVKSDKTGQRALPLTSLTSDLVVVGGGLAGVCAAITAARSGIKVVLVQDRPVLGGKIGRAHV